MALLNIPTDQNRLCLLTRRRSILVGPNVRGHEGRALPLEMAARPQSCDRHLQLVKRVLVDSQLPFCSRRRTQAIWFVLYKIVDNVFFKDVPLFVRSKLGNRKLFGMIRQNAKNGTVRRSDFIADEIG